MQRPFALPCLLVALIPLVAACPGTRAGGDTTSGLPPEASPPMLGLPPAAGAVITGLRTPESALHDEERDLYFISNVNGSMTAADGNGFISRVDPETLATDLTWIEGGKNGVELHAPKGMAIVGETLYVSDLPGVRKFDRRTGAPRGTIQLPGATFVNDITTDGKILYVSDTGIALGPGQTFLDTGSQAIWRIDGERALKIASGAELKHPNGLEIVDGRLRVVTFGGNELYELTRGLKTNIRTFPAGSLDGLAHTRSGSVLVSSWKANGVFRGFTGTILSGIAAPADIAYDHKRRRLLLPQSVANQLTLHEVN
jgi:hypothetical protein